MAATSGISLDKHREIVAEFDAENARLRRELDAAVEAVGAMSAADGKQTEEMYARFRKAERELEEARKRAQSAEGLVSALQADIAKVRSKLRQAISIVDHGFAAREADK